MKLQVIVFTVLFCRLSIAQSLDFTLLKSINHSYTPQGGKVFIPITNSVDPLAIGIPVGMFVVGKITKNKPLVFKSYEIGTASILTSLMTGGLKASIQRERPFNSYPTEIIKYTKGGSYSFPSGHTSAAFASATSVSLLYPKWYVIIPAYLWAGSVGYSRMYLGVHYPSDVLFGALLGTGISIGTHYFFNYLKRKHEAKNEAML